ncbi:hypothetical protein C8R45DRAFT_1163260 [Mycena sanguinolenta]|nr:hypothetical protein C8R45DRAFT_1163260 [Mycena sanguinolenta]
MSSGPTFPPLDNTLGAVAIGAIVSTFLFGIGTLQTYHYFNKYPEDSSRLKSAVAIVLFELGHMISTWHLIYVVTVTFYGQLQHLQVPPHSLETAMFFLGCIILTYYFANRIRVFSGRWLIPAICWTLVGLRVMVIFAMMGIQWVQPNIQTLQVKFRWLMTISLSLGMTADTGITLSMCYWLWQARHSGFARTKKMVNMLLVWTKLEWPPRGHFKFGNFFSFLADVSLGVASGMFLILFLSRNDLTWFAFFLVQAKLYSNAFLLSLNGRKRLRGSGKVLGISAGSTALGQRISDGNRGVVIEMSKVVETDARMSKDLEHGRDTDLRG